MPMTAEAPAIRRTSAAVTGIQKPPGAANSAFDVPKPPPKPRGRPRAAVLFDPSAVQIISGRPVPEAKTGVRAQSSYGALLARMKPGDSVELSHAAAKGLDTHARRHKIKTAWRVLTPTTAGVWRLE